MKTLVTGAAGFVGRHLCREMMNHGNEVAALDVAMAAPVPGAVANLTVDLQNADAVADAVAGAQPDALVHLGGISFVPAGRSDPNLMLAVNVGGTLHLLDACRRHVPACRVLVISSSHVYDASDAPQPLPETTPLRPVTLYAVSKAAADLATLAHARKFGMMAMTARPANHTGPGQRPPFVVPSLAQQIKAIAAGLAKPLIRVGNLDSVRDFCDVRDVVRAYRLILEVGKPGHAYNICGSNRVRIGQLLQTLCDLACVSPRIEVDPDKFRPTDEPPILATALLRSHTGWEPQIGFSQTLGDILAES